MPSQYLLETDNLLKKILHLSDNLATLIFSKVFFYEDVRIINFAVILFYQQYSFQR